MKAGQLTSRVEVLHLVKSVDASGARVNQWRVLGVLWADVRFATGYDTITRDLEQSTQKASVRIRYNTQINEQMRLRVGAKTYRIISVLPDLQKHAYMDLVCESVA